MPSTSIRQNEIQSARRVVVKLGTQLLTRQSKSGNGTELDTDYLAQMIQQIVTLREQGYEITLVCSGAIGAGCVELNLEERPNDVATAQAVAAVGQRRLMTHLHDAFQKHGLVVGQLLLTRADFDDRERYLNIRNCVAKLHEMNAIPVLNENDTVAVDEIRFGDNDLLAALMANAMRADLLILLTVVDGLLDEAGERIDLVDDPVAFGHQVKSSKSKWGSGGMQSKLDAARLVMEAGEPVVIANGRTEDVLAKVLKGERVGTVFKPAEKKMDSRQRWISLAARPSGQIVIDDGAVAALRDRKTSLLAKGIQVVSGQFGYGDVLAVMDTAGNEVARGLTNYGSEDLGKIQGRHSREFATIFDDAHQAIYDEVIHRDHLVLAS